MLYLYRELVTFSLLYIMAVHIWCLIFASDCNYLVISTKISHGPVWTG